MGAFNAIRKLFAPTKVKVRQYAAAKPTRLASDWVMSPVTADRDIYAGLTALRARAREEAQNNGYVRQFLRELKTNVVGHRGIMLRSRPMDPPRSQGNPTDRPQVDRAAQVAIERAWTDWGRRRNFPESSGRLGWASILAHAIENCARDGEVIIHERIGDRENPYRYSLRFIDPIYLDPTYNRELPNGNIIVMGVEMRRDRRPVAYHFAQQYDEGVDSYYFAGTARNYVRIPAEQIIHEYLPNEGVLASRGVPWVAAGLLRFNMLGGYEEAELVAARSAASKMGFVIDAPDDAEGYTGDSDPDDVEEGHEYIEETEPGYVGRLPHGAEWRNYDPQHPTGAFKDFVKTNLRGIAAGLGISYNALATDLESVNYSSLREGRIRETGVWMGLQEWLIDGLVDRVFNNWLSSALLARRIVTENGFTLPAVRIDKYRSVEWAPRRWPGVDPLKDGQAMQIRVGTNFQSVSAEIRADGRDPEQVFAEIAEERETWDRLGIAPPLPAGTLQPTEPAAAGDDQDDEGGSTNA